MKKQLLLLFIICFNAQALQAQFGQQWVKTFDGVYHNDDKAGAIALDKGGNVIVAGESDSTGQLSSKVIIVKYDPSGNPLWQTNYTNDDFCSAVDMITDSAENIFIACQVINLTPLKFDIHLLKYNCAGALVWDALFPPNGDLNIPNKIGMDNAGNIYVGASTDCNLCYAGIADEYEATIIKFNSNGNYITAVRTGQFWTFNNVINYTDLLIDMDVVSSGNIYSITNFTQESSIVDSFGSFPAQVDDYGLAKDDTNGTRKILKRISRPSKEDYPADLFIGNNEEVYITGWTKDTVANSKESYLTAKLDSGGNVQYLVERGNSAWVSKGAAVVADALGYAYVAGTTYQNGATSDIELIKYDPNGNEMWFQPYNSTFNSFDDPYSMLIDAQANLYIRASSHNGSNNDFLILKYDSSGSFQWEQRYNGTTNQEDLSTDFVMNSAGEVFVTGQSQSANGYDFLTIKYGFPTTITGDSLCSAVGINEIANDNSLIISPNPSAGNFTIVFESMIMKGNIELLNILGEKVFEENIYNESRIEIKLKNISQGIYFVKVQEGEKYYCKKLIVEHN